MDSINNECGIDHTLIKRSRLVTGEQNRGGSRGDMVLVTCPPVSANIYPLSLPSVEYRKLLPQG